MFSTLCFIAVLALLDSACALGGPLLVRPPSKHVRRSGEVESIEGGVVNWGNNASTPLNSAIISVALSKDRQ